MLFYSFNHLLFFLIIRLTIVELYIVIPLKSTDTKYFSNIKKHITINDKIIISEIFSKWINNTLYTNLIIGEPYQKATAFLSTEEYGFTFYEEYSTKELTELNLNEYNQYLKNNSKSIIPSNELNYNFSFWEYLSFEEPLNIYKFNDNDIFSMEKFNTKQLTKTKNIHFLYAIRHSSKVFNTPDFIEFEKKYQSSKDELRKLNYTSFSYFTIGLQLGGRRNMNVVKNIVGELLSKHEILSYDWSICFLDNFKNNDNNNDYIGFLFLGSAPHQYLSNIYNENEVLYTESDNVGFDWTWRASLSFYKGYIKINENVLTFNKYEMKSKLDFNFDIIKGTSSSKSLIEEYFFKPLINNGKCFESIINKNSQYSYYTYYYCDKNKIIKNDIEQFPTLFFHHLEFANIFELTYNDLFETFGDIIVFKIVFDTNNEWIFGQLFLKKYLFSYNDASKKIYFYNKKYWVNPEKQKQEIKKKYYIEVVIIIILVFIFGFLGFVIGKKIYKKYKSDANELEDIIDNEKFIKKENAIIEMRIQ